MVLQLVLRKMLNLIVTRRQQLGRLRCSLVLRAHSGRGLGGVHPEYVAAPGASPRRLAAVAVFLAVAAVGRPDTAPPRSYVDLTGWRGKAAITAIRFAALRGRSTATIAVTVKQPLPSLVAWVRKAAVIRPAEERDRSTFVFSQAGGRRLVTLSLAAERGRETSSSLEIRIDDSSAFPDTWKDFFKAALTGSQILRLTLGGKSGELQDDESAVSIWFIPKRAESQLDGLAKGADLVVWPSGGWHARYGGHVRGWGMFAGFLPFGASHHTNKMVAYWTAPVGEEPPGP